MKNTTDLLLQRRSVRSYSDKPIDADSRQLILDCTMRAPTAGNLMLYSVIDVSDQSVKDKLAVSCDNQPFIAKAPLVLLFLADYQRIYDYFITSGAEDYAASEGLDFRKPQHGDLMLAVNDALIAAQTAVTAAESLGIGSCYIGDIMENYEFHRELFKLPEYTFPVTLLCFGYPTEAASKRRLVPRFDQDFVVFENTYPETDKEKLLHLMDNMEKWEHGDKPHSYPEGNPGCRIFGRKFASDFSLEMNRSVCKALKNWEK